jgi:flagellar biosynthesis/type III secretory pathway M-ring protein FliF/YscJ
MEAQVLKVIAAVLAIVLLLLKAFIRPRPKKAREALAEESPTAKAVEEAEEKAQEKFGPRP